nr:MAG TPA: Sigma factor AlgU negative regulatory factor, TRANSCRIPTION.96A [Caudoviricetes sp.]
MGRIYFNNFYGKIDNKGIYDYQIDKDKYKLETIEERIEYIKELLNLQYINGVELNGDLFWDEIFEQKNEKRSHINLSPNANEDLATDSNICKLLESLGTYILQPDKEYRKKNKLKIYNNEEEFQKALKKEKSYMCRYGEQINEDDPMIILKPVQNIKLVPKRTINKEYINEHEELRCYQDLINHLNEIQENKELQNNINKKLNQNKNEGWFKYKCDYMKSSLRSDMEYVQNSYNPLFIPKKLLKDNGAVTWDCLDTLDVTHVKPLLQLYREKEEYDFTSDIDCILYDLGQVLKKVKFTDKQKEVLNLWMKGDTVKNIAKELNRKLPSITGMLDTIVKNIVQAYEEELEDIYYLNICKGEYKRCNKCGKVKLVSKFNKNGSKGLLSICKKCR